MFWAEEIVKELELRNIGLEKYKSEAEKERLGPMNKFVISCMIPGNDYSDFFNGNDEHAGMNFILWKELLRNVRYVNMIKNHPDVPSDLRDYNDGYINEIIQNANDTIFRSKKPRDERTIEIRLDMDEENKKYVIEASYSEMGFSLKDAYGFCRYEGGTKSGEDSTGNFGIGIKSLLPLVSELDIKSNIKIYINMDEEEEKKAVKVELAPDADWDGITRLTAIIPSNSDELIDSSDEFRKKQGSFIKRLGEFINSLSVGRIDTVSDMLWKQDRSETIFDAHALLFMGLEDEEGKERGANQLSFICRDKKYNLKAEDTWTISYVNENNNKNDCFIKTKEITTDFYVNGEVAGESQKRRFLVFRDVKDKVSVAFRINSDWSGKDHIYATYLVSESKTNFLKGGIGGILIDTKEVNRSRTALKRTDESKPPQTFETVFLDVQNKFIPKLCEELQKTDLDERKHTDILDILCHLLALSYDTLNDDIELNDGSKSNNFILNNECFNRIETMFGHRPVLFRKAGNPYYYIFVVDNATGNSDDLIETVIEKSKKKDGSNDDRFPISVKRIMGEGEPDRFCRSKICKGPGAIEDVYFLGCKEENEFFKTPEQLTQGVKMLMESWYKSPGNNKINLPFFSDIKDLFMERMGKGMPNRLKDMDIFKYIQLLDGADKTIGKILAAAYGITSLFDENGKYTDEFIRTWLFTEDDWYSKDEELKGIIEGYKADYQELKEFIKKNKYQQVCWRVNTGNYIHLYNEPGGVNRLYTPGDRFSLKIIQQIVELIEKGILKIIYVANISIPENPDDACGGMLGFSDENGIIAIYGRGRRKASWDVNDEKNVVDIRYMTVFGTPNGSGENYISQWLDIRRNIESIDQKLKGKTYVCGVGSDVKKDISLTFLASQYKAQKLSVEDLRMLADWLVPKAKEDGSFVNRIKIRVNAEEISDVGIEYAEYEVVGYLKKLGLKSFEECRVSVQPLVGGDGISQFLLYAVEYKKSDETCITKLWCRQNGGDSKEFIELSGKDREKGDQDLKVSFEGTKISKITVFFQETSRWHDTDAVFAVLEHMLHGTGEGKDELEYIKHFLEPGNVNILNARDYKFIQSALEEEGEKAESIRYAFRESYDKYQKSVEWYCERFPKISKPKLENMYHVLSKDDQYNQHCPFCGNIPTVRARVKNGGDINNLESNNMVIVTFPIKNDAGLNKQIKYFKTICCQNCYEIFKVSLGAVDIVDINKDKEEIPYLRLSIELKTGEGWNMANTSVPRCIPISPFNYALYLYDNQS
ncbi:MAG: hypothetical protein IJ794_16455 [Lachnospiraceae bacterium]|nr:hypothetical protein [Lachnospiraceae bacterium]